MSDPGKIRAAAVAALATAALSAPIAAAQAETPPAPIPGESLEPPAGPAPERGPVKQGETIVPPPATNTPSEPSGGLGAGNGEDNTPE